MEILICQFCGKMIRSRSKNCDGCGGTLTKHSPTSISNGLGGATVLAVPVQNDPLVLERAVNHIACGKNGNGNTGGQEDGSYRRYAEENDRTFLYSDADLSKISPSATVEPASAVSPPDYSAQDTYAPEPQSDTEVPVPSAQSKLTSALGSAGTPMEAGAAYAMSVISSQAASGAINTEPAEQRRDSEEAQVSNGNASCDAMANVSDNNPPQSFSPASPPANLDGPADFFSSVETVSSAVAPPPPGGPIAPPDFSAPAVNSSEQKFSQPAPLPESAPAPSAQGSGFETVAPSSAHASRRSGMMDFFSATSSAGGGQSGTMPSAAAHPVSEPTNSFTPPQQNSFSSSGQASIIQNAIQAAAALNSQASVSNRSERENRGELDSFDSVSKAESKKRGGSGKKKSSRSSTGFDGDEETEKLRSSTKKLRSGSAASDRSMPSSRSTARSRDASASKSKSGKRKTESSRKEPEKALNVLGFSMPLKAILIGLTIMGFVGFPVLVLIANLGSLIAPLMGSINGGRSPIAIVAAPTGQGLAGEWRLAFMERDGSVKPGIFVIQQSGSNIQGYGMDLNNFQLNGSVGSDGIITFNKQYLAQGRAEGKPVLYRGKLDFSSDSPQTHPQGFIYFKHISGVWKFTKNVGFSWRAHPVEYSGKWEAYLTKVGSANGQQAGPSPSVPVGAPGAKQDPAKFYLFIAFGIIGFGVFLAFCSLRFFGPSGLLNVWAKKEYIPSQFKSQHFKMVGEMGKPLRAGGCPLGSRLEWGPHQFWRPRLLNMPPEIREQNPHTLILGAGAKGKSRLMASMIAHDIESADRAVVVVDSDGALVDLIMSWIAAHPKAQQIASRVVVIDPTHEGQNLCYNPLEYPSDGDLQNAASAVVFGFKAIYTEPPGSQSQWNQQTANILRNSAVLLMANGKTLTDLPVLLSDNDFRDVMLEKVEQLKHERSEYTTLIEAWANYKRLARTDQWINWIEPILNRVQPMLGDPRIRPILTKAKSDLNLQHIISEKKILLVKIPQGQLDQNGNLLGSLMVTGIKQAALSLSVRGKDKKRPCALYLDEFDTFIEKETFDAITSETRKFQLGFCGASKTLQTLPEDYRNQIVINVGMMAVFALAKKDGDMLGPQMFRVDGRKVKHQTIQNVFNRVNSSPQFELISDEEKLNIDRVVGQEERTYFCYRVGTVAGVFNMKTPDFKDVPEKDVDFDIIEQMYANHDEAEPDDEDEEYEAEHDDEEDDEEEEED